MFCMSYGGEGTDLFSGLTKHKSRRLKMIDLVKFAEKIDNYPNLEEVDWMLEELRKEPKSTKINNFIDELLDYRTLLRESGQ